MTRLTFACLAVCGLLASCQRSARTQSGPAAGPTERYHLQGTILRRDATSKIVTVKHGPIKDDTGKVWMEAMTMDFPVPRDADFRQAPLDAHITAIVVSRPSSLDYWLEEIRPANAPPRKEANAPR